VRLLDPDDGDETCESFSLIKIFCSYLFVDRDMLMRHFGHSIGHLQFARQHEIESEDTAEGRKFARVPVGRGWCNDM